MKYLHGYLTAGILAAITWALMYFAEKFSVLVDMVYPYVIRTLQGTLAQWSSQVPFCLWQLLAVALGVGILASLVAVIITKRNVITWAGWVLAVFCGIYLLQTMMFGLNYYAGDLSDDIRLSVISYTVDDLTEATEYYRDQANALASKIQRDPQDNVVYPSFQEMAESAGEGFDYLTHERHYPVFAGSYVPVKELGWADMYTSMGITGFTFGITGEAAVNAQAPATSLPFTICHEMAHRMCIASERDANFSAFLACSVHPDVEFQYSAYFMAYRYCFNALCSVNTQEASAAAARVQTGVSDLLRHDMAQYDSFFQSRKSETSTKVANTVNDTYLKTSGETSGIASYGEVCDLLVNWHIQDVVIPTLALEIDPFDPFDTTQVDLSGIVNAR